MNFMLDDGFGQSSQVSSSVLSFYIERKNKVNSFYLSNNNIIPPASHFNYIYIHNYLSKYFSEEYF